MPQALDAHLVLMACYGLLSADASGSGQDVSAAAPPATPELAHGAAGEWAMRGGLPEPFEQPALDIFNVVTVEQARKFIARAFQVGHACIQACFHTPRQQGLRLWDGEPIDCLVQIMEMNAALASFMGGLEPAQLDYAFS